MNLPLQRFIASIFSALTVLIIFTIAAGSLPLTAAAAVGLIAAFCTPLWSTASRGLWQHGPSALLISATLLLLMKIRTRPLLAGYSGALLAFAYIVRPTNAVAFICFALYILLNSRQAFRVFILSTLLVFVPFLAFSYDFFGRILPPYYNANRLQFGWHFFEASLANLFSPNRGLFFLSPILIPAMISMWVTLKKFHFWSLPFAVLAAFCGHLTAISLFPEWWGGHAFGARYMTETIPYVIYFFVIWLAHRKADFARFSVLALAAALSFYIHFQGATNFRTFMWNVHPVNIDRAPERVWDFGDMQFLR